MAEEAVEISPRDAVLARTHYPEFADLGESRPEPKTLSDKVLSDINARREADKDSVEYNSLDEKIKRKNVLFDARDFLDAKLTETKEKPQEHQSLSEMKESIIKLVSDEELTESEHERLEYYLSDQYDKWNKEENKIIAETNRNIFTSFINAVNGRSDDDHQIEDEFDEIISKETEIMANQTELPDYQLDPKNAKRALLELAA